MLIRVRTRLTVSPCSLSAFKLEKKRLVTAVLWTGGPRVLIYAFFNLEAGKVKLKLQRLDDNTQSKSGGLTRYYTQQLLHQSISLQVHSSLFTVFLTLTSPFVNR